MDTLQVIKEDIKNILIKNGQQHLSDCLDLVPERNLAAIYNMIADLQSRKAQHKVISLQVTEDIAACLEGKEAAFSKGYLWR